MKNTLMDLNNHLFASLERLNQEDLKGDRLKTEIERGKAIGIVASQIISNASLALKAQEMKDKAVRGGFSIPAMIENDNTAAPVKETKTLIPNYKTGVVNEA